MQFAMGGRCADWTTVLLELFHEGCFGPNARKGAVANGIPMPFVAGV